jgi:hypothetical protein
MERPVSHELEKRIGDILDNHLEPILKDEWKQNLSIYDIGARGQNLLDEVIVWVRSFCLSDHVSSLMNPSTDMLIIDPVDRIGVGDGQPRLRDDTVLVRLFKPIDTEHDGSVDLLIELFQVFPDPDTAETCYNSLLSSTCRPHAIS